MRTQRGFTMVELIAVLLVVGVLAVVALPNLQGALAMRDTALRDQVLAGLRQARHLAQGHRRLVCASIASNQLTLTMAAANPAGACGNAVPGLDGQARWTNNASGLTLAVSPAGTLYFQPDGRITSDGVGATAVNASVTVGSETAITLVGDTGHVQ